MLKDVDGNGIRESHYDLDTDGSYETVLFNNSNGRFEIVYFDTSAGSVLFQDQNEDGYFELTALDADRNGQAERLFYDGDGDGYAELECLDYIGPDGLADTWVDTRVTSRDARTRGQRPDGPEHRRAQPAASAGPLVHGLHPVRPGSLAAA